MAAPTARFAVLLPLLVLAAVASSPVRRGWSQPISHDLDTYVATGHVVAAGGDPYDFDALQAALPGVEVRAWVYPRAVLPLTVPLTFLPRLALARGWAVAQVLALAAMIVLAVRGSGRPVLGALAATAAVLAWEPAIRSAIVQGNVEPFVALGIAGGVVLARRGPGGLGGALVGLASSFKLWPFALLAVPGAPSGRGRRWLAGLGIAAIVVAVELASARPFLLWREVRHMDDRGPVEPSLRALLADLVDADVLPRVTPVYVAVAVAVVTVGAVLARRTPPGAARSSLVWLAVLILVPRVQDYGWVHALVPATWAWAAHPAAVLGVLVAVIGQLAGWRYTAWLAAAATFGGLAAGLAGRRAERNAAGASEAADGTG